MRAMRWAVQRGRPPGEAKSSTPRDSAIAALLPTGQTMRVDLLEALVLLATAAAVRGAAGPAAGTQGQHPPPPAAPRRQLQPTLCADLAARKQAIDRLCFSQTPTANGPVSSKPLAACSPGCAAVIVPTWTDCSLDQATKTRLLSIATLCDAVSLNGNLPEIAGPVSGDSGGESTDWRRGSCKAGVDGGGRCLNSGTCVEEWGHHRLQGGGDCPLDDVDRRSEALNGVCCNDSTEDCSSGAPSTCDDECAGVLLPFWSDCAETLAMASNGETMTKIMQTTVSLCAEPHNTMGPPHHHCLCSDGWSGDTCFDATGRRRRRRGY